MWEIKVFCSDRFFCPKLESVGYVFEDACHWCAKIYGGKDESVFYFICGCLLCFIG